MYKHSKQITENKKNQTNNENSELNLNTIPMPNLSEGLISQYLKRKIWSI